MNDGKRKYIGATLLILASLAAGAAGAAVMVALAVGSIVFPTTAPVSPAPKSVVRDLSRVDAASRATVSFYKKRAGTTLTDSALIPSERVGNGLVVTADGWLVTAASVLATKDPLVAVLADRAVYAVDQSTVVRDDATGLAFVHLAADRLSVIQFANDDSLTAGADAFLVDPIAVHGTTISAARALPVATRADLVESTERLTRRVLFDDNGTLNGTAVVNEAGDAIGVTTAPGQAVPVSFFSVILKNVFTDASVNRPRAGVHFVSSDLLTTATVPRATGAVVTASARSLAVEKGSAGEKAGLRTGDVITAVERDRVDSDATLVELIQQYAPGANVTLTVLRAGKELRLQLTLK